MAHKIDMYIDGAAHPNPGIGAYAVLLRYGEHEKFLSAVIGDGISNQQADLLAAIAGIHALKEGWLCDITIYTNSKYLVKTMSGEWERKANADLFAALEAAIGLHRVEWVWIKSCSIPENERCHLEAEALAHGELSAAGEGGGE